MGDGLRLVIVGGAHFIKGDGVRLAIVGGLRIVIVGGTHFIKVDRVRLAMVVGEYKKPPVGRLFLPRLAWFKISFLDKGSEILR